MDDWTLQSVCNIGHFDIKQLLLQYGADIHAMDDWANIDVAKAYPRTILLLN